MNSEPVNSLTWEAPASGTSSAKTKSGKTLFHHYLSDLCLFRMEIFLELQMMQFSVELDTSLKSTDLGCMAFITLSLPLNSTHILCIFIYLL